LEDVTSSEDGHEISGPQRARQKSVQRFDDLTPRCRRNRGRIEEHHDAPHLAGILSRRAALRKSRHGHRLPAQRELKIIFRQRRNVLAMRVGHDHRQHRGGRLFRGRLRKRD